MDQIQIYNSSLDNMDYSKVQDRTTAVLDNSWEVEILQKMVTCELSNMRSDHQFL